MQDFVYRREIRAGDETIVQAIDCHIKGLRQKTATGTVWELFQENWMRVIKIEGTDYQVTTDQMLAWLSLYGDILSPIIGGSEKGSVYTTQGLESYVQNASENTPASSAKDPK